MGIDMSRVIAVVACGLALAGCASFSPGDFFAKPAPAPVTVQLESQPAGAEASASFGQSCKTPCALSVVPDKEFTVSYTLKGYQSQTVAVQLGHPEGDPDGIPTFVPNPVVAELVVAKPVRRPPAKKPAAKPVAAKPAAAAQPAAAFPAPAAANAPWPPVR
jgi:hypothetical protein